MGRTTQTGSPGGQEICSLAWLGPGGVPRDFREALSCPGQELEYCDAPERCQETSLSGRVLHLSLTELQKAGPEPKKE